MGLQHSLSRRGLMSGVAGSLIVGGSAFAQAAKRIEQFAPELDAIISTSEPIQELASGTGGTLGPTEGPLWWKEGGYLLYSDIHNNRRMKYVPGQEVSVAHEPVNRSNGLTRDLQGRLVACERATRRVVRFEHDGSTTVIAASFHKLGRIVHGRSETTNIAFGGDDWKTLYFTNWNYLGAVKLKIAGISVPVPKKT
jgi:sugar lactone lactonase YvrE